MDRMTDSRHETWEQYRRRIIREAEVYIEWGLNHPEETIPLPMKPAGDGGFPAQVGRWFWDTVLSRKQDSNVRRWLGRLRGRRRLTFVKRR